jgi:hypothetical protein
MLYISSLNPPIDFIRPTPASHQQTRKTPRADHLIFPVPDTDFRDFLDEIDQLAGFAPEIVGEIEKDLDKNAQKKKRLRLADRKFFESQTDDLPTLEITEQAISAEELKLAEGRPRMSCASVYLFLMLRGFLGSLILKTRKTLSSRINEFVQFAPVPGI